MTKLIRRNSASGFTLIELLIVIVIIGILAGVLIGVINPTAQQNKARDASVRATLNKIALATSGYMSAYGRIPMESEFLAGLTNATDSAATCTTANTADCTIEVTGNPLPATCAATGWNGAAGSTSQCYYYYCGGDDAPADGALSACVFVLGPPATGTYRIYAKAFGTNNIFLYRSADSKMWLCDNMGVNCSAMY
jgi:prepilin-type N-terminal cleavage/methylation domain-containing protein